MNANKRLENNLENQENKVNNGNNDKHMTNDGPKAKQPTATGSQTRVNGLYQPMIIDKKFNLSLVAAPA